jgi:hypothetical protein
MNKGRTKTNKNHAHFPVGIARARLHLDLKSRDGSYTPLGRIDVNNNSVPSNPHDWPASRHVTATGLVCYPFRSKQALASLERNLIIDVCGGKILTTTKQPKVWSSPQLLEGLGYQGIRSIGAFWSVVHVRGDDAGAVSWTTRQRSSALRITVPCVCTQAGPVSQASEESAMPQGSKIQTSRLANTTMQEPVGGFSVRMPSVKWLRNRRLVLGLTCMFIRRVALGLEILNQELAPALSWQSAVVE